VTGPFFHCQHDGGKKKEERKRDVGEYMGEEKKKGKEETSYHKTIRSELSFLKLAPG